jgi:membrane associated rhomboid family serine protease
MDLWVIVILGIIFGTTAYSLWKQFSFSMVVSGALLASSVLAWIALDGLHEVAVMPGDLVEPSRTYTVLTSMYVHVDILHLLFNIIGIAFIGSVLEMRISTRPYVLLYFITGICGTLAFAAVHWDDPFAGAVGASGAISGVLGGLARLYPKERFSMIVGFFPLPPMPMWVIVGLFVLLQLVFLSGQTNIAWEAHLGGLAAGLVLAPLLVRLPLHRRVQRMVSKASLRRMATTPELKAIMRRIEDEEMPDVRSAWVEHFLASAKCPYCGAPIVASRGTIRCKRGHLL